MEWKIMGWRKLEFTDKDLATIAGQRMKKARFFVDESLGSGTTEFLRGLGWNVKGVSEVGLFGRSDEEVMAYAFRENRILLSHDTDFLDDRRFPPHRNPGVVILPGGSGDESALIRSLIDVLILVAPFIDIYRRAKMQISTDGIFTVKQYDKTGAMKTSRYCYRGHGPVLEWVDE